jgi:hypothetical protein
MMPDAFLVASVKQRAANDFCGSSNPHRASASPRGILRAKAGLKLVLAFQTGLSIVVQTTLRHLCEMTKQPTRTDSNHSFSAISAKACNLARQIAPHVVVQFQSRPKFLKERSHHSRTD